MKRALLGAAVATALFWAGRALRLQARSPAAARAVPTRTACRAGAFTPDGHAHSICAFSGLEDGSEGGPAGPGNTQNWGQIPAQFRPAGGSEHPGNACNGHRLHRRRRRGVTRVPAG